MLNTKVSEVMQPISNIKCVDANEKLKKVTEILIETSKSNIVSNILAITSEGKIIGILSVGDLLKKAKYLMRSFSIEEIKQMGSLKAYGQREKILAIEDEIQRGSNLTVRDLMRFRTDKLRKDDSISVAFNMILESNLRVLPVFSDDMTLIGIVRDIDLLSYLIDYMNEFTDS